MKRIMAFLAIVLLVLNILTVTALAAIPVGNTGTSLLASYVVQDMSNWCWAASAENAIRWELASSSLTRTQWDAVNYIKGSAFIPFPNVGGAIYDSRDAAEFISMNTKEYTAAEVKKTYCFLCEEIYDSHPVIVGAGYYTSSDERNGGHAVLIMGWSTASGGEYLKYYDSYTGTYETCTYASFCDGTYNDRKYDQTCYILD